VRVEYAFASPSGKAVDRPVMHGQERAAFEPPLLYSPPSVEILRPCPTPLSPPWQGEQRGARRTFLSPVRFGSKADVSSPRASCPLSARRRLLLGSRLSMGPMTAPIRQGCRTVALALLVLVKLAGFASGNEIVFKEHCAKCHPRADSIMRGL